MKLKNIFLAIGAAVLFAATTAHAQFDFFAQPRTIVLLGPTNLTVTPQLVITNPWADIHGFDGIAKIDISICTNVASDAVLVTIDTSQDQTNITSLANAAYSTVFNLSTTNTLYGNGSNLNANTVFNLAGTVVSPVAGASGWATPYISPAPFTNTVANQALGPNGVFTIGFNASDANRYIRFRVTSSGGASTNFVIGATMTGRRAY